ncbi:hypothetical protein DFH08DRAFT_825880 [Mycena albidolilacea]|uniref:Uncharacterized protein n=1 Tax=Mycena albidolilacea TaxID=1033008 RepID=A0AAD6Z185_9AGAR|nr:hypothetical protein DFH08DRAFT_825880 [Mycena albidolilacea]
MATVDSQSAIGAKQGTPPTQSESGLSRPDCVDPTQLQPLAPLGLTENSADLHCILMPDAYTRIVSYEMAKGVDFKLENLATADPANYEMRTIVFCKGAKQATRFFIVGCVTQRSALHERVVNGRRSINVMPSIFGWGRAPGIPTSASPKKKGQTVKIPSSPVKSVGSSGEIEWEAAAARGPRLPVPIYDGRSVDFDIKNSHHLPVYAAELELGAVVMVMFTLVDESEYPPDTVVDAKDPLPIM